MSAADPYGDRRPVHLAIYVRSDGRVRVLCQGIGERPAPKRWRWTMHPNFGKGETRFDGVPWCAKCAKALASDQ